MHPILIGAHAAAPGRVAYVFSLTPGRRVTIIGPDTGDTEAAAEQIAAAVLPIITAALAPEGSAA